MAELAASDKPLDRAARRALFDYCKDKQDTVVFFTYANIKGSDDKYCRFLESTVQNGIPITVGAMPWLLIPNAVADTATRRCSRLCRC